MTEVTGTHSRIRRQLYSRIRQQQKFYNALLEGGRLPRNRILREDAARIQATLYWLVPFYRALHAVEQQRVSGGRRGSEQYAKVWNRLQAFIRTLLDYHVTSAATKALTTTLGDVELLRPDLARPPETWEVVSVFDIVKTAESALSREKARELAKRKRAEQARKAFVLSLTETQVSALQTALRAASDIGRGSVSFDARDLPAER